MTSCETCGGHVTVISGAEGTSHYEPLEGELLAILRDLGAEDLCERDYRVCLRHGWYDSTRVCPQARLRDLLIRYGSLARVAGAGE